MSFSVFYDNQIFWMQKAGGISRYYYELSKRLQNYPDVSVKMSGGTTANTYILNDPDFKERYGFQKSNSSGLVSKAMNYVVGSKKTKMSLEGDIFHPTYYDNYFLSEDIKGKVVLTVYDMIHEKFPEMFFGDPTYKYKYHSIHRADHLIAISEATKSDLIEFYDIDPDKISVVYLASSFGENAISQKPSGIDSPFVLYVGTRDNYKNFCFSIKAFSKVFREDLHLKLVIFGGSDLAPYEVGMLNELIGGRYVMVQDRSDAMLARLYSEASAFIFPSYYEGFGIPVLEAFSFGCPLVCANVSSLPEVAGPAAFYFETKSVDSLATAIRQAVAAKGDPGMLQRQQAQLVKFSWDKVAAETHEVYRKVLGL